MPKCGVCGWSFSDRTLTKHAETPCGEESVAAGSELLPGADAEDRLAAKFVFGNRDGWAECRPTLNRRLQRRLRD